MKLINSTSINSKNLHEFFLKCVESCSADVDERELLVEAVEVKGQIVSGEANIGPIVRRDGEVGLYMKVRIPMKNISGNMLSLAFVTMHELLHCAGFTHMTMDNGLQIKKEHYAWAASFKLRKKKNETPEEKHKRFSCRAKRMVVKYKKRQMAAATLASKWERKLRYHKRRVRP